MAVLSIVAFASVCATPFCVPQVPDPQEPGLQERLETIEQRLEAARVDAHVPGMSLAIVKDGEVVLMRGFGLADVDAGRAADEETVYGIGSTTKAFSATLLAMLLEERGASWDDPVREHLTYYDPEVRSPDADAVCTLRDLASHRYGFARMGVLFLTGDVSRRGILEVASGAEPWDDFRAGFHYSNVAYLAVGEVAAALAGQSWETALAERLLEPLGMRSTTLAVDAARSDPRLAVGYAWDPLDQRSSVEPMMDIGVIAAAGAMNANVVDLTHWLRMLLAGGMHGERRLLSEQALRETWEPQVEIGAGASYGLGWMLWEHEGRQVVEHGGNVDGFSAQVALVPGEALGYVLLMNQGASPLRRASLPIVLDGMLQGMDPAAGAALEAGPPLDAVRAEEQVAGTLALEDYVGSYVANFAHFRDAIFEISVQDGRLQLDIPGQRPSALEPPEARAKAPFGTEGSGASRASGASGRWRSTENRRISVSFARDEQDAVVALVLHQGPFGFEAPREGHSPECGPSALPLEAYAGTYVRENGGKRVTLFVREGLLTMQDKGNWLSFQPPNEAGEAPLRARADQGATFLADAEGNIESFVYRGNAGEQLFTRLVDPGDLPSPEELASLRNTEARLARVSQAGGQRITGKVHFPQAGVVGELTLHTRGTDRYALRLDFGRFGRIETGARGQSAWAYDPLRGHRELAGEELLQGLLAHPGAVEGDWNEYFDSVEVIGGDRVSGRPVHVVRLKKEGIPSRTYRVDAETGDVLRVNQTVVEAAIRTPITVRYFDFEERDGVRLPRRAEIENEASGRTILTFEEFSTGLVLGDEVFAPPGSERDASDPRSSAGD